jgi:CRP-like cAMP-binding protein
MMVTASEMEKMEVFSGFTTKQIKKLSLIAKKVTFKKGKKVYLSKYRAGRLFVVAKGKVELRIFDPTEVVAISFGTLGQGELFGAASLFKPPEYTVTAFCKKDSEFLVMEASDLIDLMEKDKELGFKLMKKVAQVYFDRYERSKKQIQDMVKTMSLIAVPDV